MKKIKILIILILCILIIGCDNDLNENIDTKINGNWYTIIKSMWNIPINNFPFANLPEDYSIENYLINEETGMVEIEIEFKMKIKFNNGLFEYTNGGSKGTYTTNNGNIKMKTTHVRYWRVIVEDGMMTLDPKWYTKNEIKNIPINEQINVNIEMGYLSDEQIKKLFSENIYKYYFDNDSLIIDELKYNKE